MALYAVAATPCLRTRCLRLVRHCRRGADTRGIRSHAAHELVAARRAAGTTSAAQPASGSVSGIGAPPQAAQPVWYAAQHVPSERTVSRALWSGCRSCSALPRRCS